MPFILCMHGHDAPDDAFSIHQRQHASAFASAELIGADCVSAVGASLRPAGERAEAARMQAGNDFLNAVQVRLSVRVSVGGWGIS